MGIQCLDAEASTKMESSSSSSSPLLRLFGSDPIDPLGNVRPLRNIRDKIYSYAWSRDRRDSQKLDWVISERGFNRNVPERYFPDTPHGTAAFQRLDELPCNLHLVNKQISKDFRRFIYTVNDLEIDIDLKATSTRQGNAALNKIVHILQYHNFVNFTQNVRVRIHFPARYPINNLPAFNFDLLNDIAWSLDQFQKIDRLTVRVVPMQGTLIDYELRVAAFPFYPMRMTNWSIRTFNDTNFPGQWDILDEQQAHLLDKAWALYLESGSLTEPVHPEPVHQQHACVENAPSSMPTKKNGSQKRKHRKRDAITEESFAGTSSSVDRPTASSSTAQSRPGTPPSVQSCDAEANGAQTTALKAASGIVVTDADADVDAPTCNPDFATMESLKTLKGYSVVTASLPGTPTKLHDAEDATTPSASSNGRDSVILTPADTSDDQNAPTQGAPKSDCREHEIEQSEDSLCFSEAPSSITLDLASNTHDPPDGGVEEEDNNVATEMPDNRKKQKQATGKWRKGKKKARKASQKSTGTQTADDSLVLTNPQNQLSKDSSEDTMKLLSSGHDDDAGASTFNLANVELHVVAANPKLVLYQDPETGTCRILQRDLRIERILRQQERRRVDCTKRAAEQKQARDKRQTRKAKQLLLRRGNIAENSPLSRAMQPRRESHKKESALERESPVDADHLFKGRVVESDDDSVQTQTAESDIRTGLLGKLMNQSEVNDDHDINSIVQHNVEEWAQRYPLEERYDAEQHDMHRHDMCRLAECSSDPCGVHPDGEDGYRYYDMEGRSGQVQYEQYPQSPRSTDVEAYDSQDPSPSGSERMNEHFTHGESEIASCASYDDGRRQIFYPELGGRAEAPVNTAIDYNGDNPFVTYAQHVPCHIPFVHTSFQEGGATAQGAQLNFDQSGPRGLSSRGGSDHLSAQDKGLDYGGAWPRGLSAPLYEPNDSRIAVVEEGSTFASDEEDGMFVPHEESDTAGGGEERTFPPDEGQSTFVSGEEEEEGMFVSDGEDLVSDEGGGLVSDGEGCVSDGEGYASDGEESISD